MLHSLGYEVWGEMDKELEKIINDLKQSRRAWFEKFSTVVTHYGLRRGSSDHFIFVRHFSTGTIIFAVYVDDIIVIRDDHQDII